jgi:hypothetical protein
MDVSEMKALRPRLAMPWECHAAHTPASTLLLPGSWWSADFGNASDLLKARTWKRAKPVQKRNELDLSQPNA